MAELNILFIIFLEYVSRRTTSTINNNKDHNNSPDNPFTSPYRHGAKKAFERWSRWRKSSCLLVHTNGCKFSSDWQIVRINYALLLPFSNKSVFYMYERQTDNLLGFWILSVIPVVFSLFHCLWYEVNIEKICIPPA